ncbi:hypothetical protein ILUMI_25469 [Ignelater luminosus]|uniref:Caspase-1 n=1 Tax=Ignelater luminosus TaxID=2038154 RepID=A0A8K0G014_IGNLU|nr:hypothetical protein ILUMI_25469 [Ignelater luminosus]
MRILYPYNLRDKECGNRNKVDKSDAAKVEPTVQELTEIDIDSDYYNMGHYKRGTAIIFNHYKFDDYSLNKRDGTMKDGSDLESVLKNLKFDVTVYQDLKYGAIHDVLSELSQANHSDSDCLLIAVLSHGDKGKVYAKDNAYPVDFLWNQFTGDKCITLAGKPKLFFIQACRGDEVDDGVAVRSPVQADSKHQVYTVPAMADFLVMYSTYDGYYSWRSPITGSWFIQSLCSELKEHARDKDLQTILTFVNRRMAIKYRSNVPGNYNMHAKKQIGTIVSTLTRLVHFHPPEK